jgi:threonine aldolase
MRTADFRSDTVTKPTGAMLRAMAAAEVGDDTFGDDPTVRRLEERVADLLGKEAALFVPSGVMGNLCALLVHGQPGDELLLEENAHSFHFETGGAAAVAGLQTRPIPSEHGTPSLEAIEAAIRPENIHFPRTKILVYENTNNMSGGTIVPLEVMREIHELATDRGVAVHLDGARIWHAHVATGISLDELAEPCESVMCCLSKGLSAPVGSMLAGSGGFVTDARRRRKMLGGSMRQAGVLAAAGLVALDQMVERLAEDHRRARTIAEGLAEVRGIVIDPDRVQTNIVIFRLSGPSPRYETFLAHLEKAGVRAIGLWGRGVRLVVHRHIGDAEVEQALAAVRSAADAGVLR